MTITDLYPTRIEDEAAVLPRDQQVVFGGEDDGPLTRTQLDEVEGDGYVQLPDVITSQEVAALQMELERLARDPEVLADERTIVEPDSMDDQIGIRSIFQIHESNDAFRAIAHDPRIVDLARQVLGSDVYIHQSRVNYKPGFFGKEFAWHSDFETWHAEDGMPTPRAISISISLTENHTYNGPLMIMPGTHKHYVSCTGKTPDDNYKQSLLMQGVGVPDLGILKEMADTHGIDVLTGPAGGVTMFDANCMHASNGNVTPLPRSNVFLVFNSVENACVEPFAAKTARPDFLRTTDPSPIPR